MRQPDELNVCRGYIRSVRWKFASTYADKAPHWYTVSDWDKAKRVQFERLALYIREHGYIRMYYSHPFICLNLDDHYYWTMGEAIEKTELINRALIAGAKEYK